jgi:hypothetical protein
VVLYIKGVAYQLADEIISDGGVDKKSSHWTGQVLHTQLSFTQPHLHLITLEPSPLAPAPTFN